MSDGFSIEPGTTVNEVITELLKFPRDMTFSFGGSVIDHGLGYDHIPYLEFTRYDTSKDELSGEIMGLECFECAECDETCVDTGQFTEIGDRAPQPVHVVGGRILYPENDADAKTIHEADDWENALCAKCAAGKATEAAGDDAEGETAGEPTEEETGADVETEDFPDDASDVAGSILGNLQVRITTAGGRMISEQSYASIRARDVAASIASNRAFSSRIFNKPGFYECGAKSVKWSQSGRGTAGFKMHTEFIPADTSKLVDLRDYFEKTFGKGESK